MMIFPDIPRAYTAIAESLSIILVCLPIIKKSLKEWPVIAKIFVIFISQIALQKFAGTLPLFLWIPGMILNIIWMSFSIRLLGIDHIKLRLYLTAKAFVSAELVASLSWHIYCLIMLSAEIQYSYLIEFIILAILYFFSFFFIVIEERKIDIFEMQRIIHKREVLIAIFTALSVFLFSNIGFILNISPILQIDTNNTFVIRTMMNVAGLLLLYTQQAQQHDEYLQEELRTMNNVFQQQYKQYEEYKRNSEIISRKAHDLKHQLQIIKQETNKEIQAQYIKDMEVSIRNFESKVETGNPIIDTILSQKNRYCLESGINFTSIVEGKLLNHMDIMDLSSLFGNAIDNAIEAVEKIPKEEKRIIKLKVSQAGKFIAIKLENYDLSNLNITQNHLPNTSKKDSQNHGFGLKSIKYICEKYNGNMTFNKEDNWVKLKLIFPIQ